MGVVPVEVKKSAGGKFIKAEEFDNGLVLEVVGFGKIKSDDADYGGKAEDYLVTSGRLEVGETFKYTFRSIVNEDDPESFPEDRVLESKSAALFIPFVDLDPDIGDRVWIKRSGKAKNTRYVVELYNGQDKA